MFSVVIKADVRRDWDLCLSGINTLKSLWVLLICEGQRLENGRLGLKKLSENGHSVFIFALAGLGISVVVLEFVFALLMTCPL